MTVETTDRSQNYPGSQSTLTFTFTASPDRPEDILVKNTIIATGVESDLVYNTDYTVSVNADGVGGTVTLSPTFASTVLHTVYRSTTKTQVPDYDNYNRFPADTLESNIDQLTMQILMVTEALRKRLLKIYLMLWLLTLLGMMLFLQR